MDVESIFLSYSRKDMGYTHSLHDRLEAERFAVWWDQEEVAGLDWTEQILTWLEDSDVVLVIVSQHSVRSRSVINEIHLALEDYGRRVIPVLREYTKGGLWLLIRSFQWIDARDDRDPLPDLIAALRRKPRNEPPTDPPFDPTADWPSSPPVRNALPPPRPSATRAQVMVVLSGDIAEFDAREQEGVRQLLARFAQVNPNTIKIMRIESGSVRVTLELPESVARWLLQAHQQNALIAQLLDIQEVRDLRLIQPRSTLSNWWERLRAWFVQQPRTLVAGFGGAGALVVAALVLVFMLFRGPALPPGTPVGVVAAVQGILEVKRAGATTFTRAFPGTTLLAGDRLRLGEGSSAGAVCDGDHLISVSLESGTVPCQGSINSFLLGSTALQTRSDEQTTAPRVITPRLTRVLTTTPTFTWTPGSETSQYTVTLRRGLTDLWSVPVGEATTLVYPADQPPLQAGQTYRPFVRNQRGEEETTDGIGFTVLANNDPAAQAVRGGEENMRQLDLDAPTTGLLLANLYAKNGFYAEALFFLEPSATNTAVPAPLKLQGSIYALIRMPDLAIASYERALTIARGINDLINQAEIHRALGDIYTSLADPAQATTHYEQAIQLYTQIGDIDAADQLR